MKKQLILAMLSAALLAAPYAQAGSGFSRSSSSSSSSSSASKSVAPAPKPSAPAYKPAEPKRDYGSYSSFSSGSSKKADTPKPAYTYNPAPAVAAAAPAPTPAKSGFGSEPKSNTGKKVAGVAAATALGGALYAANANHEAVAAYEAKQKAAEAPAVTDSTTARTMSAARPDTSTTTAQAQVQPTPSYSAPAPSYQQQPQVVVVQEAPRYRRDSSDDAYWYQRGRESAQREQPYQNAQRDYGTVSPSVTPSLPRAQTTQSVAPTGAPAVSNSSGSGSGVGLLIFLGIVVMLIIGALVYVALNSGDLAGKKNKQVKMAAKAANYTL